MRNQWSNQSGLRVIITIIGVLLGLGVFRTNAHAQVLSGINGNVTDVSGAAVPGAQVTVTNVATNIQTSVFTTSAGSYSFPSLLPGTYTVSISKAGFKKYVSSGVHVVANTSSAVNAVLHLGSIGTTVEVRSHAISLETNQPEMGTTISKTLYNNLPIEIGNAYGGVGPRARAIESFMFLAPGVQGGEFSHNVNGGVSFQTEVMFNGVVAAQSETQGFQQYIDPPYELVNQMRIVTDDFSAQYGLSGSAAAYTFNSGGNDFHGDGFEFLRNSGLDARQPDNTTGQNVPQKAPEDIENNFGFSVGGPVIFPGYNGRKHTFFYTSFDWYRLNQGATGFNTVPTAAERAGNFSALPTTLYVPQNVSSACVQAGATPGQPFAGNIIPSGCMSPLSQAVLKNVPLPDVTNPVNPYTNNILSQESDLPYREFNFGVTLDHTITANQSIHFAFWRNRYTQYSLGNLMTGVIQSGTYQPDLGTGVFTNYSYAVTPNLVMTAGFGWMGEINNQFDMGSPYSFAGVANAPKLPNLSFSGPSPDSSLTGWGQAWQQSINRKLGISFDNNWNYIHGNSNWLWGFEIRRTYQDDGECQQCLGNFYFNSITTSNGDNNTSDPQNINNTGNSFASFLLGTPDSVYRQYAQESRLRNFYFAPYVQDNLKLFSNLTVDLGLRWEVPVPFTETFNNVVFFNPNIKDPEPNPGGGVTMIPGAITKLGNCPVCAGYSRANVGWHDFSPRFGFSYMFNSHTVINGGVSMSYLDGGTFEYGTNKVAVDYGNDLQGFINVQSSGTNISSWGPWDGRTLAVPPFLTVSPNMLDGTSAFEFSRGDNVTPYIEQWNLSVQHQMPWNTFLTLAYVGNRDVHLSSQLIPPNQLNPQYLGQYQGALYQPLLNAAGVPAAPLPYPGFLQTWCGPAPAGGYNSNNCSVPLFQALLPYPQFSNIINTFDQSGAANYNALQVSLQKRFSQGLTFLVNYTFSKSMTNVLGDSGFTVFDNQALNRYNTKEAWAISADDQPNILNIATVYNLPFGQGHGFVSHNLLGGWQVSAIMTYQSNYPMGFGQGQGDPLIFGMGNPPNLTGQPFNLNFNAVRTDHPCSTAASGICGPKAFNTAAFAGTQPWVFGDAAPLLANFRGPFYSNENFRLAKSLSISERVKGTLDFQFFNVLNRVIPCGPDTGLTDSTYGYQTTFDCNTPRQGQIHLKLTF